MGSPHIYLASRSPRRQQLLALLGISFELADGDIDESSCCNETAEELVKRLALAKSQAGYNWVQENGKPLLPVLGSDTVVVLDGEALGKPVDKAQGVDMLLRLSNREHQVMTAVALSDANQTVVELVKTKVTFGPISEAQAERYWNTGEPLDKAGGYGIQGLGGAFVKSINGCYHNVVGLPLHQTVVLLRKLQIHTELDKSC